MPDDSGPNLMFHPFSPMFDGAIGWCHSKCPVYEDNKQRPGFPLCRARDLDQRLRSSFIWAVAGTPCIPWVQLLARGVYYEEKERKPDA